MMFAAGQLRERVELQWNDADPNIDLDEQGQVIDRWLTHSTKWASIRGLSGVENIRAKKVHADTTTEIKLRYDPGIPLDSKWRIKHGNRIFNVLSVINDGERNEWWLVMASETESKSVLGRAALTGSATVSGTATP